MLLNMLPILFMVCLVVMSQILLILEIFVALFTMEVVLVLVTLLMALSSI